MPTARPRVPEDLDVAGYTHSNFAFAIFDPVEYRIAPMGGHSEDLFARFTALKNGNPGLQMWISIGGWSFTDPGPTRPAFSEMCLWLRIRYHGDHSSILLVSATFDFHNTKRLVDWINLMSYDRHGTRDKDSKFVGPYIAPHTNMTEIDMDLDLPWQAGVPPSKVVMGMAFHGRSFQLKDPACNRPNGQCGFVYENGIGAAAGHCPKASGILNLAEIQHIVYENDLNPHWDQKAMVK
ncbi:hypothetical protein IFM62136_10170 [Aspergillus lentulus]|nr:hypothetical protein IFM62136_10170 [Aspergillus lentulus]